MEELKARAAARMEGKTVSKVTDPFLVSFGKYRGRPVEDLLADKDNYCEWLLKQPWFPKKYPELYARVLAAKPTDTPATKLATVCAQIREIYLEFGKIPDLAPFRRDLDNVRKWRFIIESLPADATEQEIKAALKQIEAIG